MDAEERSLWREVIQAAFYSSPIRSFGECDDEFAPRYLLVLSKSVEVRTSRRGLRLESASPISLPCSRHRIKHKLAILPKHLKIKMAVCRIDGTLGLVHPSGNLSFYAL